MPAPLSLEHNNASQYTLHSVHPNDSFDSRTPLLSSTSDSLHYSATPVSPSQPNTRRIVFNAGLKMAVIFVLSTAILGGTLWIALPTLADADRPALKIPKSFAELQALNALLKKYRDIYPFRIIVCYVITYLFLQAFSLPGSMYLSILGGAVYGPLRAIPLACTCVASGATLCYLLSAALGPALLTLPSLSTRLSTWSAKLHKHRANLLSFLIVIRIAPLPPHWVVNVLAPHLGVRIVPFWCSTWLGILGVTVIHCTIGGGLDEMTSPEDFHLISWRNFFGLAAVAIGVMIPVGLRYWLGRGVDVSPDAEDADLEADADLDHHSRSLSPSSEDPIIASGPRAQQGKKKSNMQPLIILSDNEDGDDFLEDDEESDTDSDIILEAGPVLSPKAADDESGIAK